MCRTHPEYGTTTYYTPPPRWGLEPVKDVMFIDDLTCRGKCDIGAAEAYISTSKERRSIHAVEVEKFVTNVTKNAQAIGMVVNPEKTQILCTTTAINYDIRAYIKIDGRRIDSGDKLKTVGYTFGRRPGPAEHIKTIRSKFGARAGCLRHLRKIGVDQATLKAVYTAFIRPVLKYASSSFHTTLTAEQSHSLERLQSTALKWSTDLTNRMKPAYRIQVCRGWT